jgi:nitrogen fixation NifU-like protein
MHEEIYKENILDHNRNPHNKGALSSYDVSHNGKNVNCGDDITLYLKFDEQDKVKEVGFEGQGCAISTAATSMLTDKIKGLNKEEIQSLTEKDILDMLGVNIGISREDCAFLSLKTLKEALNKNE